MSRTEIPLFYRQLAEWWPLFSPVADYAEEAAFYGRLLAAAGTAPAGTLLELGSGGGHNAFFLKQRFRATLTDPAEGMLAQSRRLNPECEHLVGDMRTLRLDRTFDRVFVHDAVVFMLTEADLRSAVQTAWVHCRPGGAALFAPDYLKETFQPGTDGGGSDHGARGLRYLEWTFDPDPSDTTYTVDYGFLLRDEHGDTRMVHDRHLEGLFPRQIWLDALADTGFQPSVHPLEHSEVEPGVHEVFLAVKPA